jgi:hypothetical protein
MAKGPERKFRPFSVQRAETTTQLSWGVSELECLIALTLHPLAHQLPVTTHSFSLLTRLAL